MSINTANNPWIRLVDGEVLHLIKPRRAEVNIKTIAWSLARQNRFYGHTKGEPYSTAQHCVIGCRHIEEPFKKPFLLHDASEAFLGDVTSKLKAILPDYKRIEYDHEKLLSLVFGFPYPFPPEVKRMDLIMLATEQRDLRVKGDWRELPYKPLDIKIKPWPWKKAYEEFLKEFKRLH